MILSAPQKSEARVKKKQASLRPRDRVALRKHPALARKLTAEISAARQKLKAEVAQRRAAETSLKKSEQHHGKLLAQSRTMQQQLRHLSHQILMAQEEERKLISRELHDEITQILTGIKIRLAALTMEASVNTRGIKKKIAGAQRMVEESVNIVHRFARELRPSLLDDLGLIPALHSYMKNLTKRTGLHIRFTAFAGVEKLNNSKRTVLFRVAQSALNNVAQHARASEAEVDIRKFPGNIRMEIQDNGIAFNPDRILLAARPRRLGLVSMRERVEMVGGDFAVESTPGQGTTIRVHIPFSAKEIA